MIKCCQKIKLIVRSDCLNRFAKKTITLYKEQANSSTLSSEP